jgi:hypothetical protein
MTAGDEARQIENLSVTVSLDGISAQDAGLEKGPGGDFIVPVRPFV